MMKLIAPFAIAVLATFCLTCNAETPAPENFFFGVVHLKQGEPTVGLPIAAVINSRASVSKFVSNNMPVETKTTTGAVTTTTYTSVPVETGFGTTILVYKDQAGAFFADVGYVVKDHGNTVVDAHQVVPLVHGKSVDLPVKDSEKLVLTYQ